MDPNVCLYNVVTWWYVSNLSNKYHLSLGQLRCYVLPMIGHQEHVKLPIKCLLTLLGFATAPMMNPPPPVMNLDLCLNRYIQKIKNPTPKTTRSQKQNIEAISKGLMPLSSLSLSTIIKRI